MGGLEFFLFWRVTMKKMILLGIGLLGLISMGVVAQSGHGKPGNFYKGHTHHNGETIGAPQHSGGTDKNGCHNGSVPYHCH